MKKRNRKGLELTRSISAVLLSIGMVLQPMVPAMSPLVTIHADPGDPGDNGGTGVTPAPTPSESTEPAPTPTPSVSPTPDSSATPTATPEETEPAVTIGDLSWDEANNNLTITVNGETSQVNTIKAYYYQDDVTDQKGNNHYFEMTKLNGNTWSVPFHGTSDSKTRSTYHFYKFDLLSATNSVVKSFDDKTQDILNDKTEATISYTKDDGAVNPTKANVTISHLWNEQQDNSNSYTLSFYKVNDDNTQTYVDHIDGNFERVGSYGIGKATGYQTKDISEFVEKYADKGGTYTAKLTYGGIEYPVAGDNLTIQQAPYVISSSISPENGNFNTTSKPYLTNKNVTVSVTLNEALNDQGLKLKLTDNPESIILQKQEGSNEYKGKIEVNDGDELSYDPSKFELIGSDTNNNQIQNSEAYDAFKKNAAFTIDKVAPKITGITVTNLNNGTTLTDDEIKNYQITGDNGLKITVQTETDEALIDSDNNGTDTFGVTYTLNGTSVDETKTGLSSVWMEKDNNSNNSYNIVLKKSGVYKDIKIHAVDAAGNSLDDSIFNDRVYKIDNDAPTVVLEGIYKDNDTNNKKDSTSVIFGKSSIQYKIRVSDNGTQNVSGLKMNDDNPDITYTIDDSGTKQIPDKIIDNKDGSYSIIINAPKKISKIIVFAEDNAGNVNKNEDGTINKPVVVESDKPGNPVVKVTDNKKFANDSHTISFEASDNPDEDYSGIHYISFYLTKGDTTERVSNLADFVSGDKVQVNGDTAKITNIDDPETIANLSKTLSSTVTLKANASDGTEKLNGKYVLHVTATDYCGNTSEVSSDVKEVTQEVYFDTEAPTISLTFDNAVTKKDNQAYYYYNGSNAKFTVTAKDESNGSGLADKGSLLKISGKDSEGNAIEATKVFTNKYSVDLATLTSDNGKKFADGEIKIEIKATDQAGNDQNTYTAVDKNDNTKQGIDLANSDDGKITTGTLFLDTVKPTITVKMTTPVAENKDNKVYYYNKDNAKFTVNVNDAGTSSQLATDSSVLTVTGKDKDNNTIKYTQKFVSDSTEVDLANLKSDDNKDFVDGDITIEVKAEDQAGNVQNAYTATSNGIALTNSDEGKKTTGTVFLDRVAPTITVDMDAPVEANGNVYYYKKANAKFTVKVTDADPSSKLAEYSSTLTVKRVEKDSNGNDVVVQKTNPISFKNNESVLLENLKDTSGNTFADGTIKIDVSAVDQAGNTQNKFKKEENVNYGLSIDAAKDDKGNDISEGTFVYDTTAPVATISYTDPSRTENNVIFYDEEKVNGGANASVKVVDANFDSSMITVKPAKGDKELDKVAYANDQYTVSFAPDTDHKKDGLYHLVISGTDKAGNPVEVSEPDTTNSGNAYYNSTHTPSAENGNKVVTENKIVVDTVKPVVTITYNNPSNDAYLSTEKALYYGKANENKTVSFEFTDGHVADKDFKDNNDTVYDYDLKDTDLMVYQIKDNVEKNKVNETVSGLKATASIGNDPKNDDGSYAYSFNEKDVNGEVIRKSQDRAGNPVQVVETYTGGSTSTASDTAQYHIVVDNTNPVASVAVDPSHTTFDGRDYYGKAQGDIHAKFTVKEANFDGSLIHYGTGTVGKETGKYTDDTVEWTEPGTELSTTDPNDPNKFTGDITPITTDGVYKLEIAGTDKAKNPIVADGATGQNELHKHGNTDGELWTNEKVRDTVIQGNLKVSNESGNAYFTVDIPNNSAKADELFRKENKAEVNADAVDEKSPYRIEYVLNSSLQDANISQTTGNDYKYDNSLKYTVDGEQRFNVVSAKIVDVAGNEATLDSSQSNQTNIYLDVSQPVADDINRPVASIQAHATSNITARTADGRDLYANNVELNFNITDPNHNGKITSSGLAGVYYTIKADGVVVQQQTDAEANLKNSSQYTWSTKPGQIVVGNDTNNIEVEFWGVDNAGNESNHAKYSFGIDKTGPKITVNYDNNDAQHEKYFKANRTATVTVQDRNIDFSKINIKTQVGHSNLSAAVANGSGVGNNDTRTFTIPYTQDGDYTLEITGTDAVNNVANVDYVGNGNAAPRDFTIDKTIPVIKVSFDNNDVQNGKYYKAARTATINVNEHNFLGNEVKVDQTATIQRGTTSVPGVSGFSTGSDSHNATIRYNQDGNYTLTVNYTDMAGNQAAPVTVSEFTIDQTAPVVKIDGVKNNAAYNGEVMPTVTIDDTNFSEDLASFVLNGIKIKDRSNLLTSRVVNEFGATIRFENIAAVKDNDDVYTATAVVTDLAGNVTKTQVRFSVNRFGSTYDYGDTATKSLMTKYFDKKTGSVLINEINVNQLHDQKVYLNFNGGTEELEEGKDYKITVSQMEDGSGYKYTYEIFSSVFKKQGTYSITVQSVDEAGNINTNATVKEGNDVVDVPFEFAIDTTNPVITSTENLEPDVLWTKTHDAEHTFSFTTTDNMSISKLTYAVTDAEGNPIGKEETLDADQLKSVNGMVSVDLRSANTNQYIKLTAVDAAGNTLTAMYSIYMNANALSRAWHFYWYVFLLVGAGIAVLIFFLVRNSKNKKKAA